ncbi:MAG: rod shape-determining protein MreC [Bacteroidales bacterium]|nr:rod shape-determining protein MreC [Bacteroidales bacterium]
MFRILAILKRYDFVIVFLLLELGAVLLITRHSYYQQSKIITWGNSISGAIYNAVSSVTEYFGLRTQNEMLAAENAALRSQIEESYISFDKQRFVCNDTVYLQTYHYIDARIIKSSWNKPSNYLMINKGKLHGIMPDMGVISPQGLVGVVVQTTSNFATIMPILHPDSRSSVKIKRTNSNGTLVWEGGDFRYATVIDIPTTHQLHQGDTIITSGQDPTFPKGILVGFVEETTTPPGSGFYNIRIRLATQFNVLEHAYIIHNNFKEEQDSLSMAD